MPTLSAFASLASQWLQRLRNIALKEEAKMCKSDAAVTPTLLGLSSSLSSLSSGAECLLQIVDGAIPQVYFAPNSSITAAQMSAHILDYLYKKLDQVCLVQGGEEEAYQMVLHMFVGSVLPYIEGLDSWLFEGTLDDPFEEMFFYADGAISVDKSEFWEKSYQLRQVQHQKLDVVHAAANISLTTNKKEGGERDSSSLSTYTRGKEHNNDKSRMLLEGLFPFPTLLPSFQDNVCVSELLPFQKNSTLLSKVLTWLQTVEPGSTPLPVVIVQDCLAVYIKKQVSFIGGHMLLKLMNDWRLMDELAVLRAIYLLGSGDLLQHFLTVIFSKLDKGETWDDDFELNTILQESVRNSADGMLLSAPDALVVSITKKNSLASDELSGTPTLASRPRKSNLHSSGIDGLDSLKFSYRVSWPLELIANSEAIKKYNQVMRFLLKVKRAKSVLDKTRRWMWKDKGRATTTRKHQWLVEQKLLHFVDAFHQYVMDRVYHSAWRELCEGVAAAGSLDEVIEVHEAYLLSIQRQCFVVPDKLWALIASRINSILGLALEFYTIQQTLSTGGATSAMRARCEMEIDNIEKRFDDCIAFLLRVLSFRLNVGHFPHLADLVTRINYNHFYMSDAGNLMTSSSK